MDKWYISDKLYLCCSKVSREIKRKAGEKKRLFIFRERILSCIIKLLIIVVETPVCFY